MPLSARLLADPGLLDEEIWQLFALDTPAFDDAWLRNHPQRPTDYQSWSDALIGLAGAGRIDRQRLLDASLAGLWASSRTTVLAGCHKLHSRLAPGPDELDAREVQYRSSSHFKPTQGGCWRRLAHEDWQTWAMKIEGNSGCSKNNAGKQCVMVLTSNLIEVSMIFQVPIPFQPLPPSPCRAPPSP